MKDHAQTDSSQVIALLLGVFVLLAALLFVSIRSKAAEGGESDTQVTISAAAPTMSLFAHNQSELPLSMLLINEGSVTNTEIEILYSDNNGCAEIVAASSTVEMVAFHSQETALSCATSGTNSSTCIASNDAFAEFAGAVGSNTCTGPTDLDVSYKYTIEWDYFVSSSVADGWGLSARITDAAGTTSTLTLVDNFGVTGQTYMSLASSTVDFGSLALGATATSADPLVLTNTGNDSLDVDLLIDNMTCTDGTINADSGGDPGEIRVDIGSAAFESMGSNVAGGLVTLSNFNLEAASSRTDSATQTIYWGIEIPTSGVGGTCTGGITLTATANI